MANTRKDTVFGSISSDDDEGKEESSLSVPSIVDEDVDRNMVLLLLAVGNVFVVVWKAWLARNMEQRTAQITPNS